MLGLSLDGVIAKWKRFRQLVDKHRLDLPVHNRQQLSPKSLETIRKTLAGLRTSLFLEDDVLRKAQRTPHLSISSKTYSLWRFVIPSYRGKWSDMHRLAVAWRLSRAKDVDAFRGMVMRVPRPGEDQDLALLIGNSWRSLLKKP
jgi:hypothetical protein